MAGVQGLYELGLSAILAQQGAAAAAGRNTANATTPGYRRESADLAATQEGGVRMRGFTRVDDQILSTRERTREGSRAFAQSLLHGLEELEGTLNIDEASLVDAVAQLFGGIIDLTSVPTDPGLRAKVVQNAQRMADQFNRAASAVSDAQASADRRITGLADQASQLAQEIAIANQALAVSPDGILEDRRDKAAEGLAALTGGHARIDPDGKMRVVLDGGAVLVDGDRAAKMVAVLDPAYDGHARLDVVDGNSRVDVTTAMGSGRLAAEIQLRDREAGRAAQNLDQLAYDIATRVNEVHRANVGLDGGTGRDLFAQPSGVEGAAADFRVAQAVLDDPRALASRGPGAGTGDASGLHALAALDDAPLAAGGTNTFLGAAAQLLADIGTTTRNARDSYALEEAHSDVLKGLRDSLSGVSAEEEVTRLATAQRAHQAAVKFVSTVDSLLEDLLSRL